MLARTAARDAACLAHRFHGVWPSPARNAWVAYVNVRRRLVYLGTFPTAEKAAIARDRVELKIRPKTARLNFPRRKLVPITVEAMRAESHAALKATRSSRYAGVSYDDKRTGDRPWFATIQVKKKHLALGRWASERDAAKAYDRAARHYVGSEARLNLPRARVSPADAVTLRRLALAERKKKTTSRYLGVTWHKRGKKWMARFGDKYLGLFASEVEAAQAYDEAARRALGRKARVNFSQ